MPMLLHTDSHSPSPTDHHRTFSAQAHFAMLFAPGLILCLIVTPALLIMCLDTWTSWDPTESGLGLILAYGVDVASPSMTLWTGLVGILHSLGTNPEPSAWVAMAIQVGESSLLFYYIVYRERQLVRSVQPTVAPPDESDELEDEVGVERIRAVKMTEARRLVALKDLRKEFATPRHAQLNLQALAADLASTIRSVLGLGPAYERVASDADNAKDATGGKGEDAGGAGAGETFLAVRGLSLAVNRGESFGLLGPNGAGKSTTIGMLIRRTLPTSGDAEVNGHSVLKDCPAAFKCLGVVPQDDILWDSLSCYDHLALFARLRGIPERAVDSLCVTTLIEVCQPPH